MIDIIGLGKSTGEEMCLETTEYPVSSHMKILKSNGYHRYYKTSNTLRTLGGEAALQALQDSNVDASDIDFIVAAHTGVADYPGIDFACQVGAELGIDRVRTRNVTEGCGSAVTAFDNAGQILNSTPNALGLVVQAQKVSDAHHDRFSLLNGILSDVAVASVVTSSREDRQHLLRIHSFSELSIPYFVDMMRIESGGSANPRFESPLSPEYYKPGRERIQDIYNMSSDELLDFVQLRNATMQEIIQAATQSAGWVQDPDWLFHTLEGRRSIENIAEQSAISRSNADLVGVHGHCGCADPILSFISYIQEDKLLPHEKVVLSTISTGMKWAALSGVVGGRSLN